MKDEINKCLEVLENGGIILYPTDTIWGIGCDATNEEAVKKIYALKRREETKSMLLLVDKPERILSYIKEMPELAWNLIEYTEKPLTIIYPGAKNLAKNLIGEDGTIGIRVSSNEFNKKLIERFKKPIVSTSANISGETSPSCFAEISDELKSSVEYCVNLDRNLIRNQSSSIIMLDYQMKLRLFENSFEIIRKTVLSLHNLIQTKH